MGFSPLVILVKVLILYESLKILMNAITVIKYLVTAIRAKGAL